MKKIPNKKEKKNMYSDSKLQWNICVGCEFDCVYCRPSFQRQMKRQKNRCMKCYNYEPHFHEDRLTNALPNTYGDEFIWICSSSDISCMKSEWIEKILKRVALLQHKQFFAQSKDATFFQRHKFPPNVWLGITLETNRDEGYEKISKAPPPSQRVKDAKKVKIDIITIEPIMDFDLKKFVEMIHELNPMRIYIGYDTKNCHLNEPTLAKTTQLIEELHKFTKVKPKLLREKWNY